MEAIGIQVSLRPNINGKNGIQKLIPKLGSVDDLEKIIDQYQISQVVLAMEKSEYSLLENIIKRLGEKNVEIKIQPDTLDILSGSVKTNNILGAPLIDLKTDLMPDWQQHIKRLLDVVVALSGLVILSPYYFVCGPAHLVFLQRAHYLFAGTNWI